ncbi:MAG TPA: DUF429 domain-containing protein [Anaerolineales bacterium]|nr:DUF429 domain-containing protein [Anaerolineales bacterium]
MKKPITVAHCRLEENCLSLESLGCLTSFAEFETFLSQSGPWIVGMDFPFGQPRTFIENIGWPQTWKGYVSLVSKLTRLEFVDLLTAYCKNRESGDKHHLRRTDKLANARSPMMLYRVPVGKMFFEGAPRLLKSGVSIQPCYVRDDPRIVVEAYPVLVARRWIGQRSYKNDSVKGQTSTRQAAREEILRGLRSTHVKTHFGFNIHFDDDHENEFIRDGSADQLDALLCAMQAGWAYLQRDHNFGIPVDCDPLEGWIVDPLLAGVKGKSLETK